MMSIWRKKTLLRTMTNQNNLKMKNLIVIDFISSSTMSII